jgi:PAS domain S-box-containing protein
MGKARILAEETYRSLVERVNDGVVLIQDMQFKYVNPRLAEILGCGVEELLGRPFVDYVHADDRSLVLDRYQRRMGGEQLESIYEVKLKRADGSDVLVELNAGITTYQGRPADLAIVRDVTDRKRLEQEVRERQLYLEGVLASTPDAIVTLDADCRISGWNPGAEKLFGYSAEEAIGGDLDALIAGPDPATFEEATRLTQQVLAGRAARRIESTRYRKDGTSVDVILAGAPIQVGDESVGVVAAYTDITRRKRVENALRRRTQQLEALRDVGLDIIGELNLDELLRSIVSRAIELVGATAGGFDLYRPDEGVLEFAIHIGYGREATQELPDRTTLSLGEGLAGKIWQTRQTIIVDDYAAWDGSSPVWVDHLGHSADIGVPVQWGDEFLGVLEVRADAPRKFSQNDARLLELFATQAAIAIRNARMYEETQERTAQLETLHKISARITAQSASQLDAENLLQNIVEQGCRLLGVRGGGLHLVDQVNGDLEQVVSYGYESDHTGSRLAPGEGAAGQALVTGEPILVDDYDNWEGRVAEWADERLTASLAVPLKHGDRIIGTLGFDAVAQVGSFDEDDMWLATLFADQATIAIENARLYDETAHRLAETNSLLEVSHDIVSTLDLDEVLERVIASAIEAIGPAEKGTLHLFDEERSELVVRASVGFSSETIEAAHFAPGEGYTGWVFANQQPLVVDNVKTDPRTKVIDLPEVHEERSALCVPLTFGGEATGTLTLDNVTRTEAFTHAHLNLLSIFASQAAAAIRNARLHEETERRASRLRAVNRVARRANSLLHLDDLIEAVYEEIDATFEADAFFLALYDREEHELEFRLSVDEGIREPPRRRSLEPGLSASVVTTGKPLLIHDYEQEREDLPPAEIWGTDKISRSWLGVPMRAGGEVTGVISVQAYRPFAYGDEDEQLLSTIADQVAMTLEKTSLYEESQRRANQAALLSEAGRHVSSELEPDVLLDTIVSAVRDSFDYHNVILLLLEEGSKRHPGSAPHAGEKRLWMQSIAGAYVDVLPPDISLAIGEGMIGYAAASGETQLSNDVSTDPHYVRKAEEDTRSELAVPLKSGDRVIGVLDLQDDELGAFDGLDVTTMETLATQIAAAIENARLFQAERERSAQLATVSKVAESISSTLDPDEVLRRTVEMITEAFDYYYASIMLLDEKSGDLVFKAGAGGFVGQTPVEFRQRIGEGMIGWVAHRGETLLANDVSQEPCYIPAYLVETKSELDVPLKYRDKVIGVLDLQSKEFDAFNEHDVMAMEALAGHVAAAIENARLFGVARRRVAELRAVRQASLQLTSTLELEPVLETILERALNLVSADDAHVFLYDEDRLAFGAALWEGERHEEPFDAIRPHGLTYSVARRGERIVVSDAMSHPLFEDRRWDGAIVGLPLTIGDEVQGVMNIAYQRPHAFTDEELWALDLLADQAAIAIRNARLYDETRDRALEQETLREAALALTTALERDEVVERVLAQLQRVVPYDTASVLLLRGDRASSAAVGSSTPAVDVVGGRGFPNLSEIVGLSFPLNEEHPNRDVIRTGEPLILEDAPKVYEAFKREPHAPAGIRSWLGVPMLVGDRTIGMISLDKREPGFYTDEHARLAQAFAAQAAVAFENARLYEAEQEQRQLSERLRETALLLNRSLDLQEVLEMILEQLASVIDYCSGSIQILKEGATEVIAARNLPGKEVGRTYPLEEYRYNRRLVEEARPLVIDDIREDSLGWREAEGLEHVRANIGVPLQVRDEVIGILTVDSREAEAYTEDDARLVQAFAQQAAVAIENARLFERERKQRRVSEALEEAAAAVGSSLELEEVLDRILEQVAAVVEGDAFNVMLVKDDHAQICRWRGYEQFGAETFVSTTEFYVPEVPNLQQMSQTGESMVIEDTTAYEGWVDVPVQKWLRSYIGAPIQLGGVTVGYLNADSAQQGRFGPEDARRLAAFADHAAAAIENARLYEEAQKRALEQEMLREAALAMTTALERDEVVERILAQLQEVVPYDTASVQLLQDGRLEIVGGRGFPNLGDLLGVAFDLTKEDNPNRAVIRNRQPIILADGAASYEAFRHEPHAQARIRSWLGVPMLVGDQVIGMITLDKQEPEFYNQEHARLAEAFAAQAGIAIEKAQLHQETLRQLAETEVLRETMLAAASTLDFDEVLARTVDVLERAMGIEYLGFMLPEEERTTGDTFMVSHPCVLGFEPPEAGYRFPVDECLTGQVYQTGEPRILSDIRQEGPYAAAANDVRSELAIPVKASDEVVAVLNLESSRLDAFDEQDLAFYTAIAGQLGIAMENAQLFEAEREQRQLSEALEKAAVAVSSTLELEQVLDRILEQVEQVVRGDSFNIMLIDEGEARLVRWRGYGKLGVTEEMSTYSFPVSDHPHWVEMSRSGEPVRVSDVALDEDWTTRDGWDWLRSYVAAPIRVGDTTVGFLNVGGTEPGQFSPGDAHRLETFASHAATAIENARLYERLRDHAETLELRVAERTAQLQAQYGRLEAILDSTVNGIVVTGPDGELVLANPVAREWFTQTLSPREAGLLRRTVQEMAERAEEDPEEVLELSGLDLQLRAATIQEPGVEEATAVVAIHDITHLKALDRMKSRFVSNVSHELRTPIATIKLFAHLMQKQPHKWREYLAPLAQEAEHQADLVEDILEISRVDAGRLEIKPERTNLEDLVDMVVSNSETRALEQGLTLEHVSTESAGFDNLATGSGRSGALVSLVDAQRITQVLDNLVNNAIRYTPEGGKITVSIGKAEARGRPWVTVTVADTGMGIPEDELPHVFERFFRGEKPRTMQISGTGLGLAIVKEIIELHGGFVTVESEVDEGSSFTVWLPLA